MNDETLVNPDHITINNSWSEGDENVNDIRPKNQGEGSHINIICIQINTCVYFTSTFNFLSNNFYLFRMFLYKLIFSHDK